MDILVTNDDGYMADGINILFETLSSEHTVYMVAPSEERSACSNAITMRHHIQLKNHGGNKYSVNGFPADCVNVALHAGIINKFDIVVSGINHGPNMGDDIHYSGTVAGARVGFINRKTGIAVSLNGVATAKRFKDVAEYIKEFIAAECDVLLKSPRFLNINYPDIDKEHLKGTAITFLDKRHYLDRYDIIEDMDHGRLIKLDGTVESERRVGSDFDMVMNGYVSITPLSLDATDYSAIDQIKSRIKVV